MGGRQHNLNFSVLMAMVFPLFGISAAVLSQTTSTQSILTWELLLLGSTAATLVLVIFYLRQYRGSTGNLSASFKTGSQYGRWLMVLAAFVILFPGILSRLISVRMQISRHGNMHSGYVIQILNGISPPENVFFPGMPVNNYWHFHALIAAFSKLAGTAPTLVWTLIHAVALVLTILVMREIISLLLPAQRQYGIILILALFALFGSNPLGSLHWFVREGISGLSFPDLIDLQPVALFGINMLTHPLLFYMTISGFALGVLCFVLTLLFISRILKGEGGVFDLLFALIAALGTFAFHPSIGVFIFSIIPTALAATYLANSYFKNHLLDLTWHKQQVLNLISIMKGSKAWTVALIVFVLVIGLIWFSFLFRPAGSIGSGIRIDLLSLRQILSFFSMTSLLIPFFLVGVNKAYIKRDLVQVFPIMICIFGFLLAYFARIFNQEYKFIFLSAMMMSLICTVPLDHYVFGQNSKRHVAGKAYGILLLSLMFVNILTVGTSHLLNPAVREDNFVLNGLHVESRSAYQGVPFPETEIEYIEGENYYPIGDLIFADVYQWARDNSDFQAILVLPFYHRDNSTMLILSERLPYVIDAREFNNGLPGYAGRVNQIKTIYSSDYSWTKKTQVITEIADTFPERQLLLVYPHTFQDMPQNGQQSSLILLYQGRYANLYQINN